MQAQNHREQTRARIKLTASIAVWGGSFIAIKIAVGQISPVSVIWARFLIGMTVLGIIAYQRGELGIPSWKNGFDFLLLGFLGITLHQWLQSNGLTTSEAATTAWIVSTTPVFMAMLGWVFLKERFDWGVAAGILLATLGVLLVVGKGKFDGLFSGSFGQPGDILILLSAPNWAIYSVMSRPALKRFSALKVTFYSMLFGWLLTSIQFFYTGGWADFSRLDTAGWASIFFLGFFCSALAYIFYNDGLQILSASQVGAFLYLEPLVATLIAAVILDERIVLASIVGGILILLGVYIVNQKSEPAAS